MTILVTTPEILLVNSKMEEILERELTDFELPLVELAMRYYAEIMSLANRSL